MEKHCKSCICENGKPKCSRSYCETPYNNVTFAPDPFSSEINGDETPVWMCEQCRYERAMEV